MLVMTSGSIIGIDQSYPSIYLYQSQCSSSGNLSSFKRGGPALGSGDRRQGGRSRSRGGEQRKVKGDKEKNRVGQLDERNLKKAANRYGTLPKGARIGAYLESMRVSGMTPEPMSDDTDTLDSHKSGATDPGLRY